METLASTNFTDVSAGQLIVTGANKAHLRITIISTVTADVELDNGNGNFVFINSISI